MKLGTRSILFCAFALLVAACGGGSSSSSSGGGGTPTCTPLLTASITIHPAAAGGVSPKAICVKPGGVVTFANADTVPRSVAWDNTCPTPGPTPSPTLGPIPAGSSLTATFPTVGLCQFHDAAAPTDAAFKGSIAVSDTAVGGPGY